MYRPTLAMMVLVGAAGSAYAAPPTPDDARAFMAKVDAEYKERVVHASTSDWIRETYITDDTERMSSVENDELLGFVGQTVKEAAKLKGVKLDADIARKLYLLRSSSPLAAPSDAKLRRELTSLAAQMDSEYGKAKACDAGGKKCRDIEELGLLMAKSHDEKELLDAWVGWHQTARGQRARYARFVELANQGAKEIDFPDTGAMWRSGYD